MMVNLTRRSSLKVSIDIVGDDGRIVTTPRLINRFNDKDVEWLKTVIPEWDTTFIAQELASICDGVNELQKAYELDNSDGILDRWNPQKSEGKEGKEGKEGDKLEDQQSNVFEITVRNLEQPRNSAYQYSDADVTTAFREAMLTPQANLQEVIVEWKDITRLACLDIDYHNVNPFDRPNVQQLEDVVRQITPLPLCWHPTHGKGAKLYYTNAPGFTAEELANVAGFQWIQLDCRATFDAINSTRHPCYPRSRDKSPAPCETIEDIHWTYGSCDLSYFRRMLRSEIDPADIDQWLDDHGYRIGQTLPHKECPIAPGESSDEHKESVYIGEKGVFCHRCYNRGIGSPPGFKSYGSLIESNYNNNLKLMCQKFVHWEHASVILSNMFPNVGIKTLEYIYRVLLKLTHASDDPRVTLAFLAGKGWIRSNGVWISSDGEAVLKDNKVAFVKSLPCTMIPSEKGFANNINATTALMNTGDVADYGYSDVTFIRGCKVYGQHLPYRNEYVKVIVRKEFAGVEPRYLPPRERMPTEVAWGMLEQTFPGIDKQYMKLLIAAKGASEGRLAQCPYLLVTGVSGSGKSTTPHIAAGICGDKAEEPIWVPHVDRFRQSLKDAARFSSFIIVNEIFKHANDARQSPKQALDPLLSLTEQSRSHELYVGSVSFGRLPVFILTDINFPPEIQTDVQLSRRFTFFKLHKQNFWTAFTEMNVRPHQYRMISADHCLSADTILSEVIDEFFQSPISLTEIAERLQLPTVEETADLKEEAHDTLKRFYTAVCEAPILTGQDAKKRDPVKGWKRIDRINKSPLSEVWEDICDGFTPEQWIDSRQAKSVDWSRILQLDFPIDIDIREERKSVIYVRFRSIDSIKSPSWINGRYVK